MIAGAPGAPPSGAPRGQSMDDVDPLITLLRRYQAERKAFDDGPETGDPGEEDRLAEETWYGTQRQIIQSQLPVTTAAGAIWALDYVLQSDDLFADRADS